ncbi:unnamed protein product [Ixodes pacificus]
MFLEKRLPFRRACTFSAKTRTAQNGLALPVAVASFPSSFSGALDRNWLRVGLQTPSVYGGGTKAPQRRRFVRSEGPSAQERSGLATLHFAWPAHPVEQRLLRLPDGGLPWLPLPLPQVRVGQVRRRVPLQPQLRLRAPRAGRPQWTHPEPPAGMKAFFFFRAFECANFSEAG